VLSRFTAIVAVDPERTEAGPLVELVQPVEEPSGWAAASYAAAPTAMMAGALRSAAPAAPAKLSGYSLSGPQPAPARPLKKLLKQVEKATQVRRSGLDSVLEELTQHRDATSDPGLRSALAQLCRALTRFLRNPTEAQGEVLVALDAVKRVLARTDSGQRASKLRFWE
jgi:Ca-activated chloride channel homolog